jgi:sulfide dehydrogenase cytochrome subunit
VSKIFSVPRQLRHLIPALLLAMACGTGAQPADRLNSLLAVCASCHGKDGVALGEDIPSLGGQNEAYLYGTLTDFKEGKRPSAIMRGMTRELDDGDIRALSRHYASQPYVRNPQEVDTNRAASGREVYQRLCQLCHLDEGRATTYAEYPLLAGQSLPYMQKQMKLILDKRRSVEVTKLGMLGLLSGPQIEDAMQFFAGQRVAPEQVSGGLTTPEKRKRRRRFRDDPLPYPAAPD